MRQPRIGQVYGNRDQYWARVETLRAPDYRLPNWAFDFISVHPPMVYSDPWIPETDRRGNWSLCSPTLLVNPVTAKRPDFEELRFARKVDAIRAAQDIARAKGLFVVVCS
jgi:hypothetical protein